MSFTYKPFSTSDHTLSGVIGVDGNPYFIAKDVAIFMQYSPGYAISTWLKTHPRKEVRDVLECFWLLPYQQKAVFSYPEMIEFMRSKSRYYKEGADQFVAAYEQHPLDDESRASWQVPFNTLHQMRFCRSIQDEPFVAADEVKSMKWWVEKFSVSVLKAYDRFKNDFYKFKEANYACPASVPPPCPAYDDSVYAAPTSVPPPQEDEHSLNNTRNGIDIMETEPILTQSVVREAPQCWPSSTANTAPLPTVECREEVVESEEREESETGDKSSGEEWLPSEKLTSSSSSSVLTAEEEVEEDAEMDYGEQRQTGVHATLRKRKREHSTNMPQQGIKLPRIYLNLGDKEYSLEITVQVEQVL